MLAPFRPIISPPSHLCSPITGQWYKAPYALFPRALFRHCISLAWILQDPPTSLDRHTGFSSRAKVVEVPVAYGFDFMRHACSSTLRVFITSVLAWCGKLRFVVHVDVVRVLQMNRYACHILLDSRYKTNPAGAFLPRHARMPFFAICPETTQTVVSI